MQTAHLLTQLVLFALTAGAVVWAVRVNRSDADRFPLVAPLDPRLLALIVPWLLLVAGGGWVLFSQELIPKGSPLLFTTAVGMLAVGSIAALMAALVLMQRKLAAGFVIRVDDDTLRLKLDDIDDEFPLKPGSVVARLTPRNQWLRFDITHGGRTLQLLVMVPPTQVTLARPGEVVEFIGAPLGGSGRRFCAWMRPWIRPV